ncbi:MAG TPA: acyl-CoA dehydrogenase family protein [Steroidobacteraceae bacterium]|jgi:long-chain-acyl-CoA dehydrogenase|nr:acyl-CoA dehydrogenase family protein [Steroidobacteraceae bacterium]
MQPSPAITPRTLFEHDHDMFRDSYRRFVQKEIGPHTQRWREQGFVDREAFRKSGEHGYLLMWADEKYGGSGIRDFRYEQVMIEENLRYGDIGFFNTLHSRLVGPYLGELGNEEQKQRFLPRCVAGDCILAIAMTEPGAGSDLAGMKTRAEDRGDHWVINGSKTYISNGQIADLIIVAARTVPDKTHGLGLFLVEADMPGFKRGRNLKKIGLKAQDTSELFFDNVKVPKANVLGDPTRGFYYLTQFLAEERLITATQCITNAQVAFDLAYDYISNRRVFGRPLGALQNARFKMAEMRAQIDVLQTFIDHCVTQHNAGKLTPQMAAEGKLLASELEGRVVDECLQMHGGAGYMEEFRISRMFTDARVSRIYAGASEVMKEIIARGVGLDDRKMK